MGDEGLELIQMPCMGCGNNFWFEPGSPQYCVEDGCIYIYIDHLQSELEQAQERERVMREALAEIREVYAGLDGVMPETCPEAYLERKLKECYGIAVKALSQSTAPTEPGK